MFRPTLALFSKASRLPLTSKKANKDFYKGESCYLDVFVLPGLGSVTTLARFPAFFWSVA